MKKRPEGKVKKGGVNVSYQVAARTPDPPGMTPGPRRSLGSKAREVDPLDQCDACGGTGKPLSGKPCMCQGTGRMSVAAIYLRERLVEVEAERDALKADLVDFKILLDHLTRTYRYFSDGHISKPNTYPEEFFAVAAELEENRTQEAVQEALEEIKSDNTKLRDILARLLTWINSPVLEGIVQIAAVHGFVITKEQCRDGHQACRDAKEALK
jgi:hypothetical protein